MEVFSKLFDGDWPERVDSRVQSRYNQHYNSMSEQVMASRTEIAILHSEINRLSQDVTSLTLLNRTLIEILVSTGVSSAEELDKRLSTTLERHALGETPSRYCVDCGRPQTPPSSVCPFCTELKLTAPPAKKKKSSKKKTSSKRKKSKASASKKNKN